MIEVWLDIENAPRYMVSNWGRVKNIITGRVLRATQNSGGYPCVSLRTVDGVVQHRVHKLVLTRFCPPTDHDFDVNHIDGDKTNNHVSNLEWISHDENMKHASRSGFRDPVLKNSYVKNMETGEIYKNLTSCARAIGGERRGVDRVLKGQSEKYLGYTFVYVDRN